MQSPNWCFISCEDGICSPVATFLLSMSTQRVPTVRPGHAMRPEVVLGQQLRASSTGDLSRPEGFCENTSTAMLYVIFHCGCDFILNPVSQKVIRQFLAWALLLSTQLIGVAPDLIQAPHLIQVEAFNQYRTWESPGLACKPDKYILSSARSELPPLQSTQ